MRAAHVNAPDYAVDHKTRFSPGLRLVFGPDAVFLGIDLPRQLQPFGPRPD